MERVALLSRVGAILLPLVAVFSFPSNISDTLITSDFCGDIERAQTNQRRTHSSTASETTGD